MGPGPSPCYQPLGSPRARNCVPEGLMYVQYTAPLCALFLALGPSPCLSGARLAGAHLLRSAKAHVRPVRQRRAPRTSPFCALHMELGLSPYLQYSARRGPETGLNSRSYVSGTPKAHAAHNAHHTLLLALGRSPCIWVSARRGPSAEPTFALYAKAPQRAPCALVLSPVFPLCTGVHLLRLGVALIAPNRMWQRPACLVGLV